MIAKEFEDFLLQQEDTFLTPAENLAVLIDTHNADHAILLLRSKEVCWNYFADRYLVLPNAA